jgi:hypothetical protein
VSASATTGLHGVDAEATARTFAGAVGGRDPLIDLLQHMANAVPCIKPERTSHLYGSINEYTAAVVDEQ